jgi:hypothetical protein
MKRDIDLARQLLLDIEARGADCSVSVLRTDANHDVEERVRYHLRLLVDAGLLKEVDRTASDVPCLRLTDAGHELIELSRSERRWRHAKWECQQRTGGLALVVVRGILLEWALSGRPRRFRRYTPTSADTLFVDRPRRYAPRGDIAEVADVADSDWDACADLDDADWEPTADARYVRVRPAYRNGWRKPYVAANGRVAGNAPYEATLPEFLI